MFRTGLRRFVLGAVPTLRSGHLRGAPCACGLLVADRTIPGLRSWRRSSDPKGPQGRPPARSAVRREDTHPRRRVQNKNLNARSWYPRSRPGPRNLIRPLGPVLRRQAQTLFPPFVSGLGQ